MSNISALTGIDPDDLVGGVELNEDGYLFLSYSLCG